MTIIDRVQQPEFKSVDNVLLTPPEKYVLPNGIPVYSINAGTQDVVRVSVCFKGGIWYQPQPLVASGTNYLMKEGTLNANSEQISEQIDFNGAFLNIETDALWANFNLYSLTKNAVSSLEIVRDIIQNPTFPENEFLTHISKKRQSFVVESEKVETLSSRAFNRKLFGNGHPAGRNTQLSDFDTLTVDLYQRFYQKNYGSHNAVIFATGRVTEALLKEIEKLFGTEKWGSERQPEVLNFSVKTNYEPIVVPKDNALQSSIRIGKQMPLKTDPDFHKLWVLNTVFGGYFGSRLMKNIREDKGYTYGIYSFIHSYTDVAYLGIATEVGADVREAAQREIYSEISRLKNEAISENELQLVKNYMLGDALRSFDGPFSLMEAFRAGLDFGLDFGFYMQMIETVKTVSAYDLQNMAQKYFSGDFVDVVAGK